MTGMTESGMTETSDDRTPPPTVWGTFQARDAHAMIDFLVKLGFEATAVYDDPDDPHIVQHSELNWPEGGGVMCGSNKSGPTAQEPGTAGFYVVTADPKAVHDRAVAAGAEITREIQSPPYGGLEFGVIDPEGNAWFFGSYRGEPRTSSGA